MKVKGEKVDKIDKNLSMKFMYDSLPYAGIIQFKFSGLA